MTRELDSSSDAFSDETPDGWVEVGFFPTLADAEDHGLVVLAMGLDYWLLGSEHGYRLLVEETADADVREQLELFDRESRGWPPPAGEDDGKRHRGWQLSPLLWMATAVLVYGAQNESPGRLEAAGALDTQALFRGGEWWRPITALFLHGGPGHLLGNLCAGYFVFALVLSYLGRGRGWLALAAAGVGGNLLAAAIQFPGPYHAIGASTAVFGGLGLLTGRAAVTRIDGGGLRRWRAVFSPVAAGAVLLGLFGAGGTGTDVVAHATGFAAGLGGGAMFGRHGVAR